MAKYRKKPVEVEAIQLKKSEESILSCMKFMGYTLDTTSCKMAQDRFSEYCDKLIKADKGINIKTLESDNETQIVSFEDFIIKGIEGEFYPCKPEIFAKTYELVIN